MRRMDMSADMKRQLNKEEYRVSELNASDEYDYKKIVSANHIFLKCSMKFENERVEITYNIEGKEEFATIFKEKRLTKLKALLDVGNFLNDWNYFTFSIQPENLYYDMYGKVFVMFRDIPNLENRYDEQTYLEEYKALIGCTLSGKYSYNDYVQGGMNLLKKDKFLVQIAEAENWEKVVSLLQQETERMIAYNKEKKIEVNRKSYKFEKSMTVCAFIVIGVFLLCCSYYLLWIQPYNKGVIQAQNAYLDKNYTEVIDSIQKITLNKLDHYQKYILAVSYIKCENLTDEQKTNVLSAVEIHGNEKILDYWISIGRLEAENAENIAQQLSNEQLLLYAYLKERYVLETDTELSGEEKTVKIKDLDGKIQSLTGEENTEATDE